MAPHPFRSHNVPNLSIKDVPEAWAEALRQRAARNHRSLQGELMAILEGALTQDMAAVPTGRVAGMVMGQALPTAGARQPWKTVEQVAAELRARFPQGLPSGPSSIELIRQDRDAR
jgi:plasmid stability protein